MPAASPRRAEDGFEYVATAASPRGGRGGTRSGVSGSSGYGFDVKPKPSAWAEPPGDYPIGRRLSPSAHDQQQRRNSGADAEARAAKAMLSTSNAQVFSCYPYVS